MCSDMNGENISPRLQAVKLYASIPTLQGILYGVVWYILWDRQRCVGVQGRGRDNESESKAYPQMSSADSHCKGNNILLCRSDAEIQPCTRAITQALCKFTLYKTLKQLDNTKLPLKSSQKLTQIANLLCFRRMEVVCDANILSERKYSMAFGSSHLCALITSLSECCKCPELLHGFKNQVQRTW